MTNKIIIIGHKAPDLDSVAAAIAYARYKNAAGSSNDYFPGIAGEPNLETVFVLEKFGVPCPKKIDSLVGQEAILVDHNEASQVVGEYDKAKIIEVVDHHKLDFKSSEPIDFLVRPWGSTCTILADQFFKNNFTIDKPLAGLMLSAILVDTVIAKSPTCTAIDEEIMEKLAGIAGIADWRAYGMELFKVRSRVREMSALEIIKSDFKDFNYKAGKIGIGQVETVDLSEFDGQDEKLLAQITELKKQDNYHSIVLFITDIIKEGSKFFIVSDDMALVEKALGAKVAAGIVYIDGIISRKKQVAPKFTEIFDK